MTQPPDKIVKNLCTFICQDTEQTPTFAFLRKTTEGILSFQATQQSATTKSKKDAAIPSAEEGEKTEELQKARISRRGACSAFYQLSVKFGPRLLQVIPNMWPSMAGGLLSACKSGMS